MTSVCLSSWFKISCKSRLYWPDYAMDIYNLPIPNHSSPTFLLSPNKDYSRNINVVPASFPDALFLYRAQSSLPFTIYSSLTKENDTNAQSWAGVLLHNTLPGLLIPLLTFLAHSKPSASRFCSTSTPQLCLRMFWLLQLC